MLLSFLLLWFKVIKLRRWTSVRTQMSPPEVSLISDKNFIFNHSDISLYYSVLLQILRIWSFLAKKLIEIGLMLWNAVLFEQCPPKGTGIPKLHNCENTKLKTCISCFNLVSIMSQDWSFKTQKLVHFSSNKRWHGQCLIVAKTLADFYLTQITIKCFQCYVF